MRAAILLTCFNRKQQTLSCLKNTYASLEILNRNEFDFYLVDDGSTDGTFDAVSKHYPEVNLIRSNGDLYWNRGMRLAWEQASLNKEYDFYIWLNDDLELSKDSFSMLFSNYESLSNKNSILSGICTSKDNTVSYGGYLLSDKKRIIANGIVQACDYFNGNLVLIPKSVYDKVGYLDNIYRHGKGDFDYGLRARYKGIKSYVTSKSVGFCDRHSELPVWCNEEFSLLDRIKNMYSPLGIDPLRTFVFEKRHFGFIKASYHLFTIHMRVLFPSIWVYLKKDLI